MKAAIISFDAKYVESLRQQIPNIELISYGDTISFLKETEVHKPDIVIYDTTSGIFAEDDLRYLLSKNIVKDKKIFGLISTDNQIDLSLFEDRVLFLNKEDIQKVVSAILSSDNAPHKQEPEIEISKPESVETDEFAYQSDIDSFSLKFGNLNEFSEPVGVKQPSLEIESFDIQTNHDIFKDQEFQLQPDFKVEDSHPVEPLEIEEIPLELDTFQLTPETNFEDKTLNQTSISTEITDHDKKLYPLETEPVNTKKIEPVYTEVYTEKEDKGLKYLKDIDTPKSGPSEKKITFGGESMVANFNIQISEDEIKKMALQVAREFLEKDPAMEKIIDHLQIDFQDEARRELENIKNELKDKLKKEAEVMMMREIQRMIKGELKEYVADITARIIKEKLEQIFRTY